MGTRPVALQLCGRKINKGREERAGEVTRGGEKMEVWKRKVVVCAACGSKVVRNRDRERAHTWRASHHREPAWRCWRRPSQALRASRAAAVWQRCGISLCKEKSKRKKTTQSYVSHTSDTASAKSAVRAPASSPGSRASPHPAQARAIDLSPAVHPPSRSLATTKCARRNSTQIPSTGKEDAAAASAFVREPMQPMCALLLTRARPRWPRPAPLAGSHRLVRTSRSSHGH